jgi:hypothetical protein
VSRWDIGEPGWIRSETPQAGLGRFGGYECSRTALRLNSQAINGVLTAFLCVVSRAVAAVCGEGAGYYG